MEIITAKEAAIKCTHNFLNNVMQRIRKEANEGHTSCYISDHNQRPPVSLVCSLVELGYNIRFGHHKCGDQWYVRVTWANDACGKIFNDSYDGDGRELSLGEFISLLKSEKHD